MLPVGSAPGTWGLESITLSDKVDNALSNSFVENVHFEVLDDDDASGGGGGDVRRTLTDLHRARARRERRLSRADDGAARDAPPRPQVAGTDDAASRREQYVRDGIDYGNGGSTAPRRPAVVLPARLRFAVESNQPHCAVAVSSSGQEECAH